MAKEDVVSCDLRFQFVEIRIDHSFDQLDDAMAVIGRCNPVGACLDGV